MFPVVEPSKEIHTNIHCITYIRRAPSEEVCVVVWHWSCSRLDVVTSFFINKFTIDPNSLTWIDRYTWMSGSISTTVPSSTTEEVSSRHGMVIDIDLRFQQQQRSCSGKDAKKWCAVTFNGGTRRTGGVAGWCSWTIRKCCCGRKHPKELDGCCGPFYGKLQT